MDEVLAARLAAPLPLRHMQLPNRVIRSATFEGLADRKGIPRAADVTQLYGALLGGCCGAIVTGFMAVSEEARAVQPGQCTMHSQAHADAWKPILTGLRQRFPAARLVAQLAHCGRQTLTRVTGQPAVGAGNRPCPFFRQSVRTLDTDEVADRATQFGRAAALAQNAGFDAIQLHAAHGYLIHQFLSPVTNRRRDRWAQPTAFLLACVDAVRAACGHDFPVWAKLSHGEDESGGIETSTCRATLAALDAAGLDLAEISYGTMAWAMNIFRGACPTLVASRTNPVLRKMSRLRRGWWFITNGRRVLRSLRPFEENYNVPAAALLREGVGLAVVPVGGICSSDAVRSCLLEHGLPAVALSRALVRDGRFAAGLLSGAETRSTCTHCNLCAIYCETDRPLRCYAPPAAPPRGLDA